MDRVFLINTITHWNEPPRARHQVAHALAKKHPVIFVSANRIGIPKIREEQISDNLSVIIPNFYVDHRIRTRIPVLNKIYQKWLFQKLSKECQNCIVINFDFTAKYLTGFFNKVVYYCNDDFIAMSYHFNFRWIADYQNRCEQHVIKHSGLCVATSGFLTEKIKSLNSNTFEIRLGAPDIKDMQIEYQRKATGKNLINVGLVGYLNTVDLKILLSLISNNDILLTVVGPVNKKALNEIKNYSRIKTTGTLTGKDLYEEVNQFDVGLIPYRITSKVDRTPNKLWLYLALGKPVAISNIKAIREWEFPDKFVYRAESNDEFYHLIKKACHEDNTELIKQRREFARLNSWDNRMAYFLKLCNDNF